MQLDGALFAIERRGAGGCIDLAIAFYREHMGTLTRLTACFAVPSCVAVWWLGRETEDALMMGLLLFLFASPLLGAVIAAGCGQRVFGEPLSVAGSLAKLWRRLFLLVVLASLLRLLGMILIWFLVFPALWLATRYGFLPEILYLEQLPWKKVEKRISAVTRTYFLSLMGRLIVILFFYAVVVLGLLSIADAVGSLLLDTPVFVARASGAGFQDRLEEMWDLLFTDPLIATTVHAMMWLAYPVCRLAWLFCYLDLRIRREGWDLELDCRIEAKRLEAAIG